MRPRGRALRWYRPRDEGGKAQTRRTMPMATDPTPYALGPEEGEALWGIDGALTTVKASAEQTGGRFALVEEVGRLGEGTPLHRHPEDDETFYVLEGEMTFFLGDEDRKSTRLNSSHA